MSPSTISMPEPAETAFSRRPVEKFEDAHLVPVPEQPFHRVRPDEAAASRDQNQHPAPEATRVTPNV
jgi:hypothetical protein